MEKRKQLTVWEAACIITGYGIGGGVLAMPYLAAKNGLPLAALILVIAFAASWLLHMMIAELAAKCGPGAQIVSVFSRFLFRGKAKTPLTVAFFALMAVVLVTNLAAYIAGAAEIVSGFLPLPAFAAKLVFYVLAASVVLFGLKAVGVSEKIAVTLIFLLIAVLAVCSFFVPPQPLPLAAGGLRDALAYYGMAMFAFSAFFSIPQAVEGLGGDAVKIRKAVFWGLCNNLILIAVITVCALLASREVTEVAMAGWSAGIGAWAQIVGGLFTLLAMLTTYWSISLALAGIAEEQLRLGRRLCWLVATLPSLILALLNLGGFIDFLELAGGAIAIIVAVMVVPAFRSARRELPDGMAGRFGGGFWQALVILAYILMGIGSVI
ncbi:MAG: aromatic amino acid transport family protein [Clostridia bacterium]|nr:aromatic amino acid transport family protein [Clostridia bacterium]